MAGTAILTLREATIGFGGPPLFGDLDITIHNHDRISLVGRNGVGKTTLMHCIAGLITPDLGERWVQPGITTSLLRQNYHPHGHDTIIDAVMDGLPEDERDDANRFRAERILDALQFNVDHTIPSLSGGQVRRLGLARTLVQDAEILLLDEPTNHLDIESLHWLEAYLRDYRGAVVIISHDRRFLETVSNKVLWLERKEVHVCPHGYAKFADWQDEFFQHQERKLQKQQRELDREQVWANQGITGRRKRNVRRMKLLQAARIKLQQEKSMQKKRMSGLTPEADKDKRRELVEFIKVNKIYESGQGPKIITKDLSIKIVRGDRIGILGANGSGKTSFLKLMIGEETPDSGKIKRPRNLEFSYFDQNRRDLNPTTTIRRILAPSGGDYIPVGSKIRHICAYLKDFQFDPKSVDDLVGTLSGGQQNRLLLARVLAKPGQLLILDEPTNDLDSDVLELLQDMLMQFEGTLCIVSHDRSFLDNTITQILAFDGKGGIDQHIGGYTDYARENLPEQMLPKSTRAKPAPKSAPKSAPKPARVRIGFKQKFMYKSLPGEIATLYETLAALDELLADPALYTDDRDKFDATIIDIDKTKSAISHKESAYLELIETYGESLEEK